MSLLVRGVAAGIGMASESIQNRKEKKRAKQAEGDAQDTSSEASSSVADLSRELSAMSTDDKLDTLDLDEAQNEITQPKLDPKKIGVADVSKLAAQFASAHQPTPLAAGTRYEPLNCAVILPQRRPNKRARGFINAYAPILETRSIDQDTFLSFLEMFNYASQTSPWIDAINLAQFATMPLAPGIGIAVSLAIQLAVDTGKEMTSRHRTNEFLDRINTYFFRPRGLYCMVMTWRPQSSAFSTNVNISDAADAHADKTEGGSRSFGSRFAESSGKTYGNFKFPKSAPLVFPGLDKLAAEDAEDAGDVQSAKKKSNLKGFSASVNDYKDRRARAIYAMKNPNSELAQMTQRPQFKSRYADPSHPAARGSLLGLLTGGAITIGDKREAQMSYAREHGGNPLASRMGTSSSGSRGLLGGFIGGTLIEKKNAEAEMGIDKTAGEYSGQYSGMYKDVADQHEATAKRYPNMNLLNLGAVSPMNLVKMITGRRTLYLAIVDLPSKEELKQATQILAEADPEHAQQYNSIDVEAAVSQENYQERDDAEFDAMYAREFEQAYGFPPLEESFEGPMPPAYEHEAATPAATTAMPEKS